MEADQPKSPIAEVIAVHPDHVRIAISDIHAFRRGPDVGSREDLDEARLRVGSYVRITDDEGGAILAIIDNFSLEPATDSHAERHVIEASPIGFLDPAGKFIRGGTRIAIPPKGAEPASRRDVVAVFAQVAERKRFAFSRLSNEVDIRVPLDGDRFFNKHIAIVGSTGSGKSHTLARILQQAVTEKDSPYVGLNNSHILLFDLHGEYKSAFPNANVITADDLKLPYWLMNGEELEELLLETGDNQAYNQSALLRRLVVLNKRTHGAHDRASIDTPARFDIEEILRAVTNLNAERVRSDAPDTPAIKGRSDEAFAHEDDKLRLYCQEAFEFDTSSTGSAKTKAGPWEKLEKFVARMGTRLHDPRLQFLFDPGHRERSLEDVLRQILGYKEKDNANVTVLDLSGIPFEVLSITVSLVTRLVFDFAYHLRRAQVSKEVAEKPIPFLLVYEEAHKYAPKGDASRYRACQSAIERIAKEGRKYGVTLVILSQRPSEISDSIFAQCNNFVAMRLTNPEDQAYVRRLLPDTLGPLVEALPTLSQGEALLIGDAVVMPCQVLVDRCSPEPSSVDVPYLEEWKRPWVEAEFARVAKRWVVR